MTDPPLLSVVLPTFNSGLTLERCLSTLFSQEFAHFEILLVDGVSTDNTLSIAENFKQQYGRMTILSEKDEGTYDAMNKGIAMAKGKWLYFLGSDDWLYNNKVFGDIFGNPEVLKYDVIYANVFRTGLQKVYDGPFSNKKLIAKNICHQAIFYQRTVFAITGMYNTRYKILADWDHNYKWFFNPAISKTHVDLVVANYTDHGMSGLKEDEVYQSDKFLNIYRHVYQYLDPALKLAVLKLIIYSYHIRKKYLKAVPFLGLFLTECLKKVLPRKAIHG